VPAAAVPPAAQLIPPPPMPWQQVQQQQRSGYQQRNNNGFFAVGNGQSAVNGANNGGTVQQQVIDGEYQGPVRFDPSSDIGKMQAEVRRIYSLARQLENKKYYAIIERFPEHGNEEADGAHIRRVVYKVIVAPQWQHDDPLDMYRVGQPRVNNANGNNEAHTGNPRLVRVEFGTQEASRDFIRMFRRATADIFEDADRKPFACRDLTGPERALQRQMRAYCWEKNREAGRYIYRYANLRVYPVAQQQQQSDGEN
jgi:hypothetical protein